MITSESPAQEELRYLASLITPTPESQNSTSECVQQGSEAKPVYKPNSLSDANIIERMDHHGITMLALVAGRLSDNITQKLKPRKALMIANSTLKLTVLNKLFEAFKNAGLRQCILFKGVALAHSYYPQPWLRPSSDTDCLIAPNDRVKFDKLFEKLNFTKLLAIDGELVSYQSTYGKKLPGKSTLNIDLHWRINNRQTLAKTYDISELSERGTSVASLGHSIIIPSAVDSILLACLHRLGHHANDERLIWLYDIHLLINTLNEDDWEEFCLLNEDKHVAAITLDALTTCQDLLKTQIPSGPLKTLRKLAKRNEPSQLFLQRNLSEWAIFKEDLKALGSLKLKIQLVTETLFPSKDYIRAQMGTQNIYKGHAKRFIRGMIRALKKPNK